MRASVLRPVQFPPPKTPHKIERAAWIAALRRWVPPLLFSLYL